MKSFFFVLFTICFVAISTLAQESPKKKKNVFDVVNGGLDKVNRGLNKVLGYTTVQGSWRSHGGGCFERFGNFNELQANSPFNEKYALYLENILEYSIELSSLNQKNFGFALYNKYGNQVQMQFSQGTGEINHRFKVDVSGDYTLIVFTLRRTNEALDDTGGDFELAINTKQISYVEKNYHQVTGLSFGEFGGGGIGNGVNSLGGTLDSRMFSPRNKAFKVNLIADSYFHVILEAYRIKAKISIVDPYGNLVSYGDNEALCQVKKAGEYYIYVSTVDIGAKGNFDIQFAGIFADKPQEVKFDSLFESNPIKAGSVKEYSFRVGENSVFEVMLEAYDRACRVAIYDEKGSELHGWSNDQAIIVVQNQQKIKAKIECTKTLSKPYTVGFWGVFVQNGIGGSQKNNVSIEVQTSPGVKKNNEVASTSNRLNQSPPGYKELIEEGSKKFQEKVYGEALTKFEKALSMKNNRDTLAAMYAGISAQLANNTEKTEKYFTTYINSGGKDVSIFYSLSNLYIQQRNINKALEVLNKGLQIHPASIDLSNMIVNTLITENRVDDAISHLNSIIARRPNDAQLVTNLAIILDNKGDKIGAIKNYEKAISIDPNQFEALYNLGVYYFNEGANRMTAGQTLNSQRPNFTKANSYFERAYKLRTYECELVNNLNKTYGLLGSSKQVECYGSPTEQPRQEALVTINTQDYLGEWRGELRGAMYYNFNLYITSFEGNQFSGYYTDEEGRIVKRNMQGTVIGNKFNIQLDAISVEGTLSGNVIKGTGKLATPDDLQLLLTRKIVKYNNEKIVDRSTYEYKGIIMNKQTKMIPSDVIVFYEDLETGEILGQTNVDNLTGAFMLYLPYGKRYGISAKGEGLISTSTNIDLTKSSTNPNALVSELIVATIKAGNAIVLNNIFFETGKATLLPESFLELNRIADFLKINTGIITEIAGHTDNIGTDAANQVLSQDRANAVRYYLQSRGIQASRLLGKGYGKTRPIASNTTDAGRQLNRRVEFVILKE